MLIFGLASIAHTTETGWEYSRHADYFGDSATRTVSDVYTFSGWEYSRHVDDFDDSVSHIAKNVYIKNNGETFLVSVACDKTKGLHVVFDPGNHLHFRSTISVDVRVDKNPKQSFVAKWLKGFAHIVAESRETYRLISDLMYGSKLIFRVGDSDVATVSLYRSIEPISKVLKACHVLPHD